MGGVRVGARTSGVRFTGTAAVKETARVCRAGGGVV